MQLQLRTLAVLASLAFASAATLAQNTAPAAPAAPMAPAVAAVASKPAMAPLTTASAAKPQAVTKTAMPTTAAPGGGGGKVWVNTKSKSYHCEGTKFYGLTKAGEYMSEADAKAKGNHAAQAKGCAAK